MIRYDSMLRLVLGMILVLATFNAGRASDTSSPDVSDLMSLISGNNDSYITAVDLAFFLATHNYDAVPEDGYVVVRLDRRSCKLVPNGKEPGLAVVTDL